MHNGVPIFRPGDMILVGPSSREKIRAQIVSFRVNTATAGKRLYGCDVITEEGEVKFYPLADIVRWNEHKVREWFK